MTRDIAYRAAIRAGYDASTAEIYAYGRALGESSYDALGQALVYTGRKPGFGRERP